MTESDPYQAPKARLEAPIERRKERPKYATTGQRFLNFVIDVFVVQLLNVGLGLAVGIVLVALHGPDVEFEGTALELALQFASGLVWFTYYTLFEGLIGRTPGKFVTKTRVEHAQGGPIKLRQAVGRSLCRLIPFEAFTFLGGNPGWHDKIPRTRVVRDVVEFRARRPSTAARPAAPANRSS